MESIYLLCLIIFPITMIYKAEPLYQSKEKVLLSKIDTQFLRGVAACFVVIAHSCTWINTLDETAMNIFFYFVVSQLGGIGNLIFFFVSGYGIYKSYADKVASWNYLWKRLKSVYFPYLLIKLVLIILNSMINRRITFSIRELVSILLVEDWFIQVILIQYIAFFILWKFLNVKKIILYSFLFDGVLSGMAIIVGTFAGWYNALWLFTFGMVCSQYEKEICSFFERRTWMKVVLCWGFFCVLGSIFAVNKGTYWANLFKPLAGVFLCLGICGLLQKYQFSSKAMLHLGKYSLYLYIIHINVWSLINVDNYVVKFWIALIGSVIFVELSYRLVDLLYLMTIHSAKNRIGR